MTVDSPQPAVQRLPGTSTAASAPSDGSSLPPAPRSGGAKVRILETASRLFYDEGIHGVGVDRLISEASVTKATFYKHYGSKDNLILAYVTAQHERVQQRFEQVVDGASDAQDAVRAWVASLVSDVNDPAFRGCAFLNAAAEYHDPRSPVRQVVAMHRDWYTERLGDLLQEAGHPMPGDGADELMLARDGAMSGAYAGDAIAATAALQRVADRVLAG
ncbi:TetR/AcrR family transcriptional regulator [Microbacterium sp. M1A1_1b]|uniref:TetR/AcrR family transcriptional regulator n=1 Tax=Curtobacterium sp. VKM Ac-2922 TaxID=2929475 RepID=UPI001FB243B6|nr:TetR/AcrR family transcriptional regulator [Curtobacterium sp. VKM Ac-2922]MCJ1713681.1 TetR/AcrR family transcriptional regulator [Curtobacterium sp. VKM Ac-2922]